MKDFRVLKAYAQNRKLPDVIKICNVSETWVNYAYNLAKSLSNTSDAALAQRTDQHIKGTEIDDYASLTKFYNQRYLSQIDLPSEVSKIENIHHLRFGVLEANSTIPFHLDEPFTYRLLFMVKGSHVFETEKGNSYIMSPGEVWFVNGSYKHSIKNLSNEERIALLAKFEKSDNNLRMLNELL